MTAIKIFTLIQKENGLEHTANIGLNCRVVQDIYLPNAYEKIFDVFQSI